MTITLRLKHGTQKDGRTYIYFDVAHKQPHQERVQRKKVSTSIKVKPTDILKKNFRVKGSNKNSESINQAIKKLEEQRDTALTRFEQKSFTYNQVVNYLKGESDFSSVDTYIDTEIKKTRSTATYNDYLNTLKAFKKHCDLASQDTISFNEFSNYNMLSEFKRNAINNGVKATSLNSYFKKIRAILNDAYDKGFIYTKFTLNKNLKSPVQSNEEVIQTVDTEDIIELCKSQELSIYDCQALGLYLLMFGLRGMYQADIVALKDAKFRKNDFPKKSIYSLFNDGNSYIVHRRHKTKNRANDALVIRIDETIPVLIKKLKRLFKITHEGQDILSDKSYALFDYDLNNQHLHKNLWDYYQKRIKKLLGTPFKTARKTFNTYATELEVSDTIKNILLGHAPQSLADKHYTNRRTKKISEKVQEAHEEILEEFNFSGCMPLLLAHMIRYDEIRYPVYLEGMKRNDERAISLLFS